MDDNIPVLTVADIPVLTVAVRASDGAVFHMKDWNKPEVKKFLKTFHTSMNATRDRWRHLVKQLIKHNQVCRVRMLISYRGHDPVFEEMVYRPIAVTEKVKNTVGTMKQGIHRKPVEPVF